MAFGLQVTNSGGSIQIDETYRNMLKITEGSGSAVTGGFRFSIAKQTSAPPMVFVLPASDTVFVGGMSTWNTATTTELILSSNGNFDYVVYGLDSPAAMDSSAFGLSVYTSAGALAYDSRYEAVRLQSTWLEAQPIPDPYNGGAATAYPYTFTFTSWGGRPWILMNSLPMLNENNGASLCASTSGTSGVVVRCGYQFTTPWNWCRNSASDPGTNDLANSYPTGQLQIAIARRFN